GSNGRPQATSRFFGSSWLKLSNTYYEDSKTRRNTKTTWYLQSFGVFTNVVFEIRGPRGRKVSEPITHAGFAPIERKRNLVGARRREPFEWRALNPACVVFEKASGWNRVSVAASACKILTP